MTRPAHPTRPRRPWRQRLLRPLLIVLGINALLFAVYTAPQVIKRRNAAARVAVLKEEVAKERKLRDAVEERRRLLKANTEDTRRFLNDVVPDVKNAVATLDYLQSVTKELGLQSKSRSFDPQNVKGLPLMRYAVSMPVAGSYDRVVRFLDALERQPRFLTVDQIAIRQARESGTELNVVISAYFRREAKGVGEETVEASGGE
jgi:Tfp pilus assembly protein PilO